MEEKIDRQPPERLEDEVSSLTANEQATAGQLRLMDPQLAGLYEHGIRLMRQIHQPENVYLLAHCGRELSKGVLESLLGDEGLEVSVQELGTDHRPRIARALGLPETDPRVDGWYKLHGRFSELVHWKYPVHEPRLRVSVVEEGADARGTGAEAAAGLALAQAQVCQRPDGPAAQGALRAWRLEGCPDGPQVLPEARRGTTQDGTGRPQ